MASRKRKISGSSDDQRQAKQPRHEEDDDLEAILARIREQEESEALARKLQDEWNDGPAQAGPSLTTAIDVDAQEEDDEALAIRLSLEEAQASQRASSSRDSAPVASNSTPNGFGRRTPAPSRKRVSNPLRATDSAGQFDEPPDASLSQFRDMFIADRPCSKCGEVIKSPRGFVTFSANNPPPSLTTLLHATCDKCNTNHCRGCFSVLACPVSCKGKAKNANCVVDTCCAEIRAIALFEALGGFDRQYLGERANSEARARDAASRQSKKASQSVGPGGTGYGTGAGAHYDYGFDPGYYPGGRGRGRGKGRGAGRTMATRSNVNQETSKSLAEHWDEVVVRAFTTIISYLPSPYSESAQVYDMLPHPAIQPLLSLSHLPELLGTLLRNDSINDWISRSEVYYSMLALLRRLADCEVTLKVLIDEQWEKQKTAGIEEWMWREGEIAWETVKDTGKGAASRISRLAPLYAHFKKLTRQSEAFLAGASQLMEGDEDADVQEMAIKATSLCGDIIAARDDIDRAMKVLGKSDSPEAEEMHAQPVSNGVGNHKGKGRDAAVDMEKAYSRACERLAFKHVDLAVDGRYPQYNYAPSLQQTSSATRNPKDRLHLVKELAVMATCLPPGVWVRVDEVRNDAIKIMIAGPEGTPYEGGLFEFDCFMPLEYPNKPPLVHLRTTGGGRVRFNPNLYANGKVCLSLLGTWPGRPEEQWSSKSTLLQVLVSIQSMILIDLPYFNEPGYGMADPKNPQSIAYNNRTRLQTVRWAMVEWLKNEPRNGLWSDVIASHFTIRQAAIRKTIHAWAAKQPTMRKYTLGTTREAGVMGMPMPQGNLYGAQYASSNGPVSEKMDLLADFDRGLQRVQAWNIFELHDS
ncbi:hypothetical protein DENSPDRAFT_837440 [Dentipellis sp. KUC8613]|nr:hypothetical protein DENSPDRAFT_837440 [Dentipellis sp. KUC8613]